MHAEDQYWEEGHLTGGGKAYKSVSLGGSYIVRTSFVFWHQIKVLNSHVDTALLQFAARILESVGQGRVR